MGGPQHNHRRGSLTSPAELNSPEQPPSLPQRPPGSYDQAPLDQSLRYPPSSPLGFYTSHMNLRTPINEEPSQLGHEGQSFTDRSTGLNTYPPQGISHNYARELAVDGVFYYAEDGASAGIWAQPVSLHGEGRAVYRPDFDPRIEVSSSDFSPHHRYRSTRFSHTAPPISTFSNLDNSIDPITAERSGVGAQHIVRGVASSEEQLHLGAQPATSGTAPIPSRPAQTLPAPRGSTTEFTPSPVSPEFSRLSYSFDRLEYQVQTSPFAPQMPLHRGKRKMTLDGQDEPAIHTQNRIEDIDTGGDAFEAIMDEGFPFEGCLILAPTSPEGKKCPSGMSPKRRMSRHKVPRKPMGMEDRAAVKQNRINGVCVRCKMFKEKCRGGFPCQRCCELKISGWKAICVTSQLVEKQVFSRGLYRARAINLSKKVIQEWKEENSVLGRMVQVSNGYAPFLRLEVHEFKPQNLGLLDDVIWQDNKRSRFTRLSSTPFGIKDELSLHQLCDEYMDAHLPLLVQELEECSDNMIYIQTIKTAYQCIWKKDGLLRSALRIWVIHTVLFKRPWRINPSSTENLGMSTITDGSSQSRGIMPLPKLLSRQLDSILESRAAELEHHVLTEIQNMIFRRLPAEWFCVFLTMSVFLSAVERDTWNLETWRLEMINQEYNKDTSAQGDNLHWPLPDTPASCFIQRNAALVETLVAHFLSVTRGNIPFTINWRSDLVKQLAADPDAVTYMETIGEKIRCSNSFLRSRRAAVYSPEDETSMDLKFTSKLMLSDDEND